MDGDAAGAGGGPARRQQEREYGSGERDDPGDDEHAAVGVRLDVGLNLLEQLRTASTSAFDYTYVTQQLAAHEKALKLHQGYAAGGDRAPLKAIARDIAPVIEHHLQDIRRISATIAAPAS